MASVYEEYRLIHAGIFTYHLAAVGSYLLIHMELEKMEVVLVPTAATGESGYSKRT